MSGAARSISPPREPRRSAWVCGAIWPRPTTGRRCVFYVNGVQVGTRALTGAMSMSTNPLRLGGNAPWGEYFQGLIDEVRIYNVARTATEIQS